MLFKNYIALSLALITSVPALAAPFGEDTGLSARDLEKREIANLIVENLLAHGLLLDTPGSFQTRDYSEYGVFEARASPAWAGGRSASLAGAGGSIQSCSPARARSCSPARGRSPSPARGRSPSPARGRSPSPVRGRLPSPSPSPARGRPSSLPHAGLSKPLPTNAGPSNGSPSTARPVSGRVLSKPNPPPPPFAVAVPNPNPPPYQGSSTSMDTQAPNANAPNYSSNKPSQAGHPSKLETIQEE